jgi:hypothetical protein
MKMEDYFNGVFKWKTTSNVENGRRPQFLTTEDDLKYLKREEGKTASSSLMEDDFNFLENRS